MAMSPANIPKSMKAAVIKAPGKGFSIEEVPVPAPSKGQVLVKVEASSICHSDSITVDGHFPNIKYPRIPGHEVVGKIVARGPDVPERFKEGLRIGVGWHGGHCFACDPCRAGNFQKCQNEKITGIHFDGGHAEFMAVGFEALAIIPEEFDVAEAAPLLCAGITVFNGIRKNGRVGPGDIVAIVGIGGLGALAIQFALKFGLRVIAISGSASKKDVCVKELGLREEDYIDSSKEDPVQKLKSLGGAKCLVLVAPNSELSSKYLPALSVDGTALVLGIDMKPLQVSSAALVQANSRVQGHASGTAWDSEECVKFAKFQNIHPIIERFKLEEITAAYKKMMDGAIKFRGVIVFDK